MKDSPSLETAITLDNIHTYLPPEDFASTARLEARTQLKNLLSLDAKAVDQRFHKLVIAPTVTPPKNPDDANEVRLYRAQLVQNGLLNLFQRHADNTYSTTSDIAAYLREFIGGSDQDFTVLLETIYQKVFHGHKQNIGTKTSLSQTEFDQLSQLIIDNPIALLAKPKNPQTVRTVWEVSLLYSAAKRERM